MGNYISGAAIRSPIQGNPSNPRFRRDQMLDTDENDGVGFLFDLAFPFSYPGGPVDGRPAPANPINGSLIQNVVEIGDGAFATSSGGTTYAGGGFDFAGVSDRYHEVRAPASALASIIASANQHFSVCFYVKLPALADWYSGTGLIPLFCTNDHASGFAGAPDLLTIGMRTGGQLQAGRSTTAVGTVENRTVTLPEAMAGQLTQVLYYRSAAGTELRVKNSAGVLNSTVANGARSSLNLAGCQPRWGICQALWDFSSKPSLANAKKWRLYRGWVENLETSGRDAIAVADADFQRVLARGVFG